MRLQPQAYARAYFYDAMANFNLRRLKEAESSAREAIQADTSHAFPLAEYLLGMSLAERNEAAGAAEHLALFLELEPRSTFAPSAMARLTQVRGLAKP